MSVTGSLEHIIIKLEFLQINHVLLLVLMFSYIELMSMFNALDGYCEVQCDFR